MKNCRSGGSTQIKKQNLRVFWKLMNLREYVWEIRYRIIIKTILQEKERIRYSTTIWFTTIPQAMKIPAAKAAVDKEWEKLGKDSGVGPDESQK